MKTILFFLLSIAFTPLAFSNENSQETHYEVTKPVIHIIGIDCRTSNQPHEGPQDIPKLWGKFYSENISSQIPNKASEDVIALYCDYETDHTGPYTFVIGCPVNSIDEIPHGMVAKTIPEGKYAIFKAVGKYPKTLIEAWVSIWGNKELKRTLTGDYELYKPDFFERSPQEVEIYIAIES